jgi:DNA-binding winged helix-turn-helix (wHTH) protein/tetratricopeptide (TPR) repeat protein
VPHTARQVAGNNALLYLFGPFALNPAGYRLTREGRRLAVPAKAWQILLMLVEAGGRLVPHDALRARLWPNVVVEDRTLTVHMSTLRKVLGVGSSSDIIETVSGAGYRLAVPVRLARVAESPPPVAGPTVSARPPFAPPAWQAGIPAVLAAAGRVAEVARPSGSWTVPPLLQARAHLKPFTRLSVLKALTLFEQALAVDPRCAPAHAGLGLAYLMLASTAMQRPLPPDEAMPMARRAAERALALDERLPEAWAVLGRIKMEYDWDWTGSAMDLAHAVSLDAGSVESRAAYGRLLSALGRHEEAVEILERAYGLDPENLETLQHLAIGCWMAGRPDAALQALAATLAISPDTARAHYGRMLILDQLGRHDEAMAERLVALRGLNVAEGVSDHIETVARRDGWRPTMEAWIGLLQRTNRWEGAAMQWMAAGEPERTLDALEHCLKARTTYLCLAAEGPCFRPLRGNPRFERILQTIGIDGGARLEAVVLPSVGALGARNGGK